MSKKPAENKHIRTMYGAFGRVEGHTCGECIHLVAYAYGHTFFKCKLTAMTFSMDWRKGWQACGKFVDVEVMKRIEKPLSDFED